jgi:acyl dehydratase
VKNLTAVEIGQKWTSDWIYLSQSEINDFGRVTRDETPFHMDSDWAKQHSPYGTTIAYGFQSLSMLTYFSHAVFGWPTDGTREEGYGVNYGLDRVRFTAPIIVNQRFRAHFTLKEVSMKKPGEKRTRFSVEIEVEGSDQPALVAEWLGMMVWGAGHETLKERVQ